MTRAPLTDIETDILLLANEGLSNRQIAERVSKPFNSVITTLSNCKRKGFKLPTHRPLDATAERDRKRQEKREQRGRQGVTDYEPAPRFTAKGVKKSTGEKFTITSDGQAHSDKWLAYMVGVGDG